MRSTTIAGASRMLPFAAARVIVWKLKLKSNKEWNAWSKSGKRPSNIPAGPHNTYRDDGWISWPDWLGKKGGVGAMLPFAAARAIVRRLKLKGAKEWEEWSKAGERPSNIPSNPNKMYRDDGWISMPDWLGNGGTAHNRMLSFAVARAIVRKLNMKDLKEWKAWRSSGQRPSNIPSNPYNTYSDDGWISYPDWLGYEKQCDMLPFATARAIVRKLDMKGGEEWKAWSKAGKRPSNIPSDPARVYRGDGWISMPDFLGYVGRVVAKSEDMLPFAAARVIARKLQLKGQKEWKVWRRSGQRPSNIPANPDNAYRDDGWISWPDWLGYSSKR